MANPAFERAVEQATGKSIEDLRRTPIDEQRSATEAELRRPLCFVSRFPFIGRGNVLRDRLLSHQQVEADLQRALHGKS
jgi:hypothetical protein